MYQDQQQQTFSPAGGSPLPNISATPGVTSLTKTDPASSSRAGEFQQGSLPGANVTQGMYPPTLQGVSALQQNFPVSSQVPNPSVYGTQTAPGYSQPTGTTLPQTEDEKGRSYTSTILAGVAGATVAGIAGYAMASHNNPSTHVSPSSGSPYPPPIQGGSAPYPPSGSAPYPPSSSGPYPSSSGAPYPPGGRPPYPPSSSAPYPPGNAPYPSGATPYPPGAPPTSGYGSVAGYGAAAAIGAAAGYGAASYGMSPSYAGSYSAPPPAGYAAPPAGYAPPPAGYAVPPAGYALPTTYAPPSYSYPFGYSSMQPFIVPVGLAPNLASKMMQASAAFRMYDTNRSGSLSRKEFKKALKFLGFHLHKGGAKALFYTIDYNHSGKVNEREFCEWWITAFPY